MREPLNALWERSVRVAAMAMCRAQLDANQPDNALLAGLMHGMGRCNHHPFGRSPACSPMPRPTSRSSASGTRPSRSWFWKAGTCSGPGRGGGKFEHVDREPGASPDLTDVLARRLPARLFSDGSGGPGGAACRDQRQPPPGPVGGVRAEGAAGVLSRNWPAARRARRLSADGQRRSVGVAAPESAVVLNCFTNTGRHGVCIEDSDGN